MNKTANHQDFLTNIQYHHYNNLKAEVTAINGWELINPIVSFDNHIKNIDGASATVYNQSEMVYNLVSTAISTNDLLEYTYGVCVLQNGSIIDYVLSLSGDYEKTRSFVDLCNDEELCYVHFHDVIEDFFDIRIR